MSVLWAIVERACSLCGASAEVEGVDDVPPGWSLSFTERGVLFQCAQCVRDNIRAIEAKLPEEYWE